MKVQIIIGSTRPGRVSAKLAKWVVKEAGKLDGVEAELVDLADYPLPMLDEPISPQYNPERTPNPEAKKWLDKLSEADALVLVTPEYNRSTSGVLKNALDYIDFQLVKKPVALVGHGSTGGAQAIGHLRGIIPGLKSFTTPSATFVLGSALAGISDEGEISEELASQPYGPKKALETTLTELKWYGDALSMARSKDV